MEGKPGTYVLILYCNKATKVQVGKWGAMTVQPGYYAYVGSAFGSGGVRARVSRHCRYEKKKHWHVDYLSLVTELESIWYSHAPEHLEHQWAGVLNGLKGASAVKDFGSTDCQCSSHLFYFSKKPALASFRKKVDVEVRATDCNFA